MKNLSILYFFTIFVSGQSLEVDRLEIKRTKFLNLIESYKDSISKVENQILYLNKKEYEESIKSGSLILYANADAPLRKEPNVISEVLYRLPSNTELKVEETDGIYYKVYSSFGRGYISKNVVKTSIIPSKINIGKSTSSFEKGYISTNSSGTSSNSSTKPYPNSFDKSYKPKAKASSSYKSSKSYSQSRNYYKGPRGGCYYINSNGNKTYVARSKC